MCQNFLYVMNVKNASFYNIIGGLRFIPLLSSFTNYFPLILVLKYLKNYLSFKKFNTFKIFQLIIKFFLIFESYFQI